MNWKPSLSSNQPKSKSTGLRNRRNFAPVHLPETFQVLVVEPGSIPLSSLRGPQFKGDQKKGVTESIYYPIFLAGPHCASSMAASFQWPQLVEPQ